MSDITLKAEKREVTGRKVKNLRNDGFVPANIYGKDVDSLAVKVSEKDFRTVFEEAGETGIIYIDIDGEKRPVLVGDVQVHPVTEAFIHADFRQVDLTKKVTATVPLEVIGVSPAEKNGIGVVVQHLMEIDAEALPTDFPDAIEVDVSSLLEVDDAITIADLNYDKSKIELDAEEDQVVVNVAPPAKEEEPLEELSPDDVEITGEAEVDESEAEADKEEKEPTDSQESEEDQS